MTRAFGKNFGLLMMSNLLAPAFSMVLVLAIAKLQGAEALGRYSVVMTVFVFGQSCAALGLPIVITREVARHPADAAKYLSSASAITAALLLAAFAIAVPLLYIFTAEREIFWSITIVLAALVPSTIAFYGEAILLAFERAGDFVQVNLTENVVRTVVGSALVFTGHGIVAIALAIFAVRLLAVGAFLLALRRRGVRFPSPIDRGLCLSLVRDMAVTGAIPVVNAVYTRADIFLLTVFGTWADVGVYSAAVRLVDIARTIPQAYSRALYPILARLRVSPDDFRRAAQESLRNVLLIVVPVAVLMSALASTIVPTLYGAKLAAASTSLSILAWSIVPVAMAAVLAQMLFASGKQHIDLQVNIVMMLVSVLLNLFAIPRWGAPAAAATAVASTILYAALQYLWVEQNIIGLASIGYCGKILLVGVTSCALAAAIAWNVGVVTAGAAGMTCYVGGILLARLVTLHDWQRMRDLIAPSERT
jgi:O-antigen/teichoic acid export membrane protein